MPDVSPEIRDLVKRLGEGQTAEFTPAERDAARAISQHVGVRKDAGSGSLIIGWFPWDGDADEDDAFAEDLVLGSGISAKDLHLTLLYLGDSDQYDLDLVTAALKLFSVTWCWPIPGKIAGLGRFVGDGEEDVIVALVDCPDLIWIRDQLQGYLSECGIWAPLTPGGHGFVPHITLAYVPPTQDVPLKLSEPIEFTIDSITVAGSDYTGEPYRNRFDFPTGYWDEEDVNPLYAARRIVEKAGRVISGKNMKLVRAAAEALQKLADAAAREEEEKTEKTFAQVEEENSPELTHYFTKERVEDRYTFGPLYAPERKDAHNEFTDGETLQKAVWEYVRESSEDGRRINLQHDDSGDATCGEWVEVCSWPYETTIKVAVPGEDERELVMPANTVYMGVIWDEDAWKMVKNRELTGYSLGGRAVRASFPDLELDHMGDKLAEKGVVAKSMHEYEAGEGGVCESCGETEADGNHLDSTSKTAMSAEDVLRLAAAASSSLSEREQVQRAAEREHMAKIHESAREERGLLREALAALSEAVVQRAKPDKPGDTHVHLGNTELSPHVTIHEPAIEVKPSDVVIREAPAPNVKVDVSMPDTIKTVPGATKNTVTRRNADGLVEETTTTPVE